MSLRRSSFTHETKLLMAFTISLYSCGGVKIKAIKFASRHMYSMNRTLKLKFNGLNRQELIVVGILVVIVAVITAQRFLLGQATYYNNFLIIKQSFYHLVGNK